MGLQTTFGGYKIRQTRRHHFQRQTHRGHCSTRGECVVNIVHPWDIDLCGALPHRRNQLHGGGIQTQFITCAVHCTDRFVQTKVMHSNATRLSTLPPNRRIRIVRWKHHHAAINNAVNHIGVLQSNRLNCLHELLMLALGVVDNRNIWLGNRCKLRGFPWVVHAQLNHCTLVGRV